MTEEVRYERWTIITDHVTSGDVPAALEASYQKAVGGQDAERKRLTDEGAVDVSFIGDWRIPGVRAQVDAAIKAVELLDQLLPGDLYVELHGVYGSTHADDGITVSVNQIETRRTPPPVAAPNAAT